MTLAQYAAEFDRCAHWIESALPYSNGCYAIDDVRDFVLSGKMQLWPGERSAAVTMVSHFPQKSVCTVVFAGGSLDELSEMQTPIEAFARGQGCELISVIGRAGWARALGSGRVSHTVSIKEL